MPFAENFKNSKQSSIVDKFKNEYEDKCKNKNLSQNEIIEYLDKEKNKEQNKERVADYDYIISLIKNWFANKQSFDRAKAQKTILSRLSKDPELQQKIAKASNIQQILALAEEMLGKNFVGFLKSKYVLTKKQFWIRKR